MSVFKTVDSCRVLSNKKINPIFDLGDIAFSGIFPSSLNDDIPKVPLVLAYSPDSYLVQLHHSYDESFMYGDNYGYRSGLNQSMVNHLNNKANSLIKEITISNNDYVLDIGANDGTFLNNFSSLTQNLIGIDPSAKKFEEHFPKNTKYVYDFFSKEIWKSNFGNKKPKLISSIAMFYDLPDPVKFARDIFDIIDDDGVWHLEQSYLLSMLNTNSFDTICHEHTEYYSIHSIKYILSQANLFINDIGFNDINGGSFWLNVSKKEKTTPLVDFYIEHEKSLGLLSIDIFENFKKQSSFLSSELKNLIIRLKNDGKKVFGLGASTKGNILLSYAGIDFTFLDYILEVNPNKFNCFTPGTKIPIISEDEGFKHQPDYLVVLPWHFKNNFINNYKTKYPNIKLIFPLPDLKIF